MILEDNLKNEMYTKKKLDSQTYYYDLVISVFFCVFFFCLRGSNKNILVAQSQILDLPKRRRVQIRKDDKVNKHVLDCPSYTDMLFRYLS